MSGEDILSGLRRNVAELKAQKLQAVAAKDEIERYARELNGLAKTLEQFAENPLAVAASHVRGEMNRLNTLAKMSLIDDLEDSTNKARILQGRVDEFKANME